MESKTERINGIKINLGTTTDAELKLLAGYTMRRALDARHDLSKIEDEYARRSELGSGANSTVGNNFFSREKREAKYYELGPEETWGDGC